MRFGGEAWAWWRLALPVGVLILSAGGASAQPGQRGQTEPATTAQPTSPGVNAPAAGAHAGGAGPAQPAAPGSGDALSPLRLMDGPSLRETGRIAVSPSPLPTGVIENDVTPSSPKEKSIARAASSIDTAPAPRPSGVIDPRALDKEVAEHFQEIAGCRVEVARGKQVMPAQIVADKLLLRWIIQPDGSTASTDVVAIQPVDLGIMDCAKRVMSQWRFTRPRGGSMTVERPFSFP
jgi:hypothetical protein